MEATIIEALISFGPGGILAGICFYKWQKAEDRNEKLRDALDVKTREFYETLLAEQKESFKNSLRVEGIVANSNQVIATNTVALQSVIKG